MNPKKINEYSYVIEKTNNMNVPLKIFASEELLKKMMEDDSLKQGINVACLPGIQEYSIMMPDAHQGYGFSIGGVAAFDLEKGIISPGGIGYDINCGVRLLTSNLTKEEIQNKIPELLEVLFKKIPPGVGEKSIFKVNDQELNEVMTQGPEWAVKKGIGTQEDIEMCESNGKMLNANPEKVSQKARSRGKSQLGTLGSGNHFIEIQYIDEIYDEEIAKKFGINKEKQIMILIHSGSRGLGHQVCSDYIRKMEENNKEELPDQSLINAPINSELGKDYYEAMCAAANFAWTNRHIMAHQVRESFKEVFKKEIELKTVYDVAHNIAKIEEHEINGKTKKVLVHRKGATRAFPKHHEELPKKYKETGQPIFIPGSMGTSSYVLAGSTNSMKESFGSTAHGAGRLLSRFAAKKKWTGNQIKKELQEKNIMIKAASMNGITEEAPLAYKDVDEVVQISNKAGIGILIAKLKPLGVIKG
ncbi:RtcB family protein [Candidatus Woesearchaeota archaeon]|nr:RtcB family protein [Candidatus Woesearchaeota archaeon]